MKTPSRPGRFLAGVFVGVVAGQLVGWATGLRGVETPSPVDAEPLVALREQNALLRQLQLVDREALVVLRGQMVDLNARNADLERRLDLLRGVLLPHGRTPDLGVGEVTLTRHAGEVAYRVLLVRVAAGDDAPALAGRVRLWLLGQEAGGDAQPALLLAEQSLSLSRLQVLSGAGPVAATFAPQRLRVDLEPKGQAPRRFEFPWREALAARATSPP
ncbi:DUF6776 family protein [Immundisolibacter sp.]|uniref:DUF6776 family protein n=1 Tax=Immundisolibacter sp. TaxID=1934948 RepID=UPI003F83CCAF